MATSHRPTTGQVPALLAAIHDDPCDDTSRLAYADWLEEHADSARAEFIRVQVELAAAGETGARHVEQLRAREAKLLAKHKRKWLAPLYKAIPKKAHLSPAFRRGFIEQLDLPVKWLVEYGGAIVRACPALHRLKVYRAAGWGARLATSPVLAQTRDLTLPCWIQDRDGAALAESAQLGQLQRLAVWLRCPGGNTRLCRALGRSKAWPNLRELVLVWGDRRTAEPVNSEAGRPLARTYDPERDRTYHFAPGFGERFYTGRLPGGRQVLGVLPLEYESGRVVYLLFDAAGHPLEEREFPVEAREYLPSRKELDSLKQRKREGLESYLRRFRRLRVNAVNRAFRARLGAEGADIRVREFEFRTVEGPRIMPGLGILAEGAWNQPDDPEEDPDGAEYVLGNGEVVESWTGDDGEFRLESFPGRQIWYMQGGMCVAT
jgi:uncharacterized protein (TIGR02996 family)